MPTNSLRIARLAFCTKFSPPSRALFLAAIIAMISSRWSRLRHCLQIENLIDYASSSTPGARSLNNQTTYPLYKWKWIDFCRNKKKRRQIVYVSTLPNAASWNFVTNFFITIVSVFRDPCYTLYEEFLNSFQQFLLHTYTSRVRGNEKKKQ